MFVGLGNPGAGYAGHRHNIGFMLADRLAGPAMFKSKFKGHIAETTIGGNRVLILKPQTYMNLSGESVREAATFYKIDNERIVVAHDELDLDPGQLRIKRGGGNGGHNGLRSMDAHMGVDYWRLRMGIGHPGDKDRVSPYVLSDFSKEEQKTWVPDFLDACERALQLFLAGEPEKMMSKVALDMKSRA